MLIQSLSGVRGIFGKSLTLDTASKYAAAYALVVKPKLIVVGMDSRHSGPAIKTAMIGALSCKIIDVGTLPTPAIQNAIRHFKADGGIIITASHNPQEWNGFKFLRKDGSVLYEKEMETIIAKYKHLSSKSPSLSKKTIALRKKEEAIEAYQKFLFGIVGKKSLEAIKKQDLTIILDPNGGAGVIAKEILESAGVRVIAFNMNAGEFAHEIEPTKSSLSYLTSEIRKHKAAFAAGFDCDADRVEIALQNGEMLSGNEMIALSVAHMLKNSKNKKRETIVVNNATSTIVKDVAQKFKAKLVEVEVGEANVVWMMKKTRSKIGGEGSSSGVIVAPSTSRDGILGVLLMAALIAQERKPLPKLLDVLPKSRYLKEKVGVLPSQVPKIKNHVAKYYRTKSTQVSLNPNGALKAWITNRSFVWLRESKTEEGVLRVIVDAPTQKEATFLMKEVLSLVRNAQLS